MKTIEIDQDSPEWMELRLGRITGSKLGNIVAKRGGRKDAFYQLIADRLAIPDETPEDARDRGHRLEVEAMEQLEKIIKKKIDKKPGVWVSDDNENIILSPDGGIKNKKGEYTEAVEVKCFDAKSHLRAIVEDQVPIKYWLQLIQYFVVNDKLEKLYSVFYDPRVTSKPLHVIETTREAVNVEVVEYKNYEVEILKEIDKIVEELAF